MRVVVVGIGLLSWLGCGSKSSDCTEAVGRGTAQVVAVEAGVAPKAVPKLKPAASKKRGKPKAFAMALRAGRALTKTKHYVAAMVKFEVALAVVHDDAAALSELGWAALWAGDLERAETATTASIEHATMPKLKAASLYNLGRIAEERGRKDAAIDAYSRSLALRPNQIVEKHLASLQKRKIRDVLSPRPLSGPYKRIEAACVVPAPDSIDMPPCPIRVGHTLASPTAPFQAVRTLRLLSEPGEKVWDATDCVLAIETGGTWYFDNPVECTETLGFTQVNGIALVAQANALPVLRVDFLNNLSSNVADYNEEHSVFCGVGTSGVPHCTPAILTHDFGADYYSGSSADEDDVDEAPYDSKVAVSLGADGVLSVGTKKRKLVFP